MRARLLVLVSAVVLVAVAAGAAVVWWRGGIGTLVGRERCTASIGDESVSLTTEQAEAAATIAAVGVRRGLSQRAVTVALATALQESKLRNLPDGDRDSAGLFQQRPSQGWGSYADVTDPVGATDRFYDALLRIPGYGSLPVAEAAQRVQHSAYPEAYAKHVPAATVLSTTLTGREPAGFSCTVRTDAVPAQPTDGTALTERAARVRSELVSQFGPLQVDGSRRTVLVEVPASGSGRRTGWAVAQWAVANASRLHVTSVVYDARAWTARVSPDGWQASNGPAPATRVRLTVAAGTSG